MSGPQKFRIIDGGRDKPPNSLDEARKRARPLIRYWLGKVERAALSGRLKPIDLMVAKKLASCGPSANEGRCYLGQEALGKAVARSARTARESLKRLCADGLLHCKRGGPGRTAAWTFCFQPHGAKQPTPIFGGDLKDAAASPTSKSVETAAQERKTSAGLERQQVADKPSELDPTERNPPTPSANVVKFAAPPTTTPRAVPAEGTASGQPTKEVQADVALDGEVIVGEISFAEFWSAARKRGKEGFARAEWRKLSRADVSAISDRLQRDGRLNMRDLWAGSWLRDRVWEEPQQVQPDVNFDPAPSVENVIAAPGSDLWRVEREHYRAAGHHQMMKLMDAWAKQGKGWWCRQEAPT